MIALLLNFGLVIGSVRAGASSEVDVEARFGHARAVRPAEVAAMHYQRIDCGRRVYTAEGRSLEGDANLKVTRLTDELAEVEFPSTLSLLAFGGINPFGGAIDEYTTAASRRLVTLKGRSKGQALTFTKTVRAGGGPAPIDLPGEVEVRVLENGYPPTYVIRETIRATRELRLFYICR